MQTLLLFIIIPLVAGCITLIIGRKNNFLADLVAISTVIILLILSCKAWQFFGQNGVLAYSVAGCSAPEGILLVGDGFSLFMLIGIILYKFTAI